MANRAYLFSLGNRPTSYTDRPDTISGLSEWAYAVPFCYRVLMSGDPRLCASFVSDGFEDEPPDRKTSLHAISSDFELGFARMKRFMAVLRPLAEAAPAPALLSQLDEASAFLEAHRDRYLLLETVELDLMSAEGGPALRACVEAEIAACCRVGEAIDALPADIADAGVRLKAAAATQLDGPLAAFYGLKLDDHFDDVRDGHTEHPLGLSGWSEVLYYQLWNRAELEANRAEPAAIAASAERGRAGLYLRILLIAVVVVLGVCALGLWLFSRRDTETRAICQHHIVCTETFDLKDGRSVRIECPSAGNEDHPLDASCARNASGCECAPLDNR